MDQDAQKRGVAGAQGEKRELDLRGTNQSGMRAHNERLVLSLIRRLGALSKTEIARSSGLSAQTVSVIMRALEGDGLLIREAPVRGKVGQPSVPMALAPDGAFFFGLKVGRRSIEMVLINFLGEVQRRCARTYAYPRFDETVEFARDSAAELLTVIAPKNRRRIAGLGIALPSQLWDWAPSLGIENVKLADWRDRDLRDEIEAELQIPVLLQNDATAACGAELVFGTGNLPANFLYFYVGFFIGGGVVLGNRLFSGPSGNAGAVGSMPITAPDGSPGQLLNVASLRGLEISLRNAGMNTAVLWETTDAWCTERVVFSHWISEASAGIANAVASSTCLLDLDTVVIDGWLPEALREQLLSAVIFELRKIDVSGASIPSVLAGTVGPDARTLGAASLPLSQRFLLDTAA